MLLDFAANELTVKLVYYGPALSGKTTNLQAIRWLGKYDSSDQLMTLETRDHRTLFFDILPITICTDSGLRIRLKLFGVPGQAMHNVTRRLLLQGADGVAFIADSQQNGAEANRESFLGLSRNLQERGVDPARMPIVLQFNKRDLPDVRSDEELDELAARSREPIYKAIATRGHGVMQTLRGLVERTFYGLEQEHRLEDKLGIGPDGLIAEIHSGLQNGPRRRAT